MTNVYIAGVGMTRFGKHLERPLRGLTALALEEALLDAGCEKVALQAAFFGNCVQGHMEGQTMIRGQIALRSLGIEGIPVANVENACATGATALHLAATYIRAGAADIALAVGAEKMLSQDKAKMFRAFDGAWDVHDVERSKETLLRMGEGVPVPEGTTSERPYSVFMDVYAASSRLHMKKYGTTREAFAAVSAKNHAHSVHNPKAQFQKPLSLRDILDAPPIVFPLTLPMCSPISDGAAAAILCNDDGLMRMGVDRERALRVLATVVRTGTDRRATDLDDHVSRHAADEAYRLAGVAPEQISVAEVHDATATGEVLEVEALRLVAPGRGAAAALDGETALGGRIPVNPSGGLESKGHPIGATGLGQIYELAHQLRGEADGRQVSSATIAIAQNGGGIVGVEEAVSAVTILAQH